MHRYIPNCLCFVPSFHGSFCNTPRLCRTKDCTAWGNHFSAPLRPKHCCAGVDEGESAAGESLL